MFSSGIGRTAVGCAVILVAIVALSWWRLSSRLERLGPFIAQSAALAVEMKGVEKVPLDEARGKVDLAWDLDRVLADPEGATGKWVLVEGTVVELDDSPAGSGDSFLVGDVAADLETGRVLAVMPVEEGQPPEAGARVLVLGRVLESQPFIAAQESTGAFGDPGDWLILAVGAKTWEVVG